MAFHSSHQYPIPDPSDHSSRAIATPSLQAQWSANAHTIALLTPFFPTKRALRTIDWRLVCTTSAPRTEGVLHILKIKSTPSFQLSVRSRFRGCVDTVYHSNMHCTYIRPSNLNIIHAHSLSLLGFPFCVPFSLTAWVLFPARKTYANIIGIRFTHNAI